MLRHASAAPRRDREKKEKLLKNQLCTLNNSLTCFALQAHTLALPNWAGLLMYVPRRATTRASKLQKGRMGKQALCV
jgi:hypothetical protein